MTVITSAPKPATSTKPLDYTGPLGLGQPVDDMLDAAGRAPWLDAFRGFVMFCLISRGFGFGRLKSPDGAFDWAVPIARQLEHVEWVGVTPWDMIQPLFMFVVGVAMPFAFAKRAAAGESWGRNLLHVLKRCGLLLLWAHLAMSISSGRPQLEFINVLNQIAFTYLIAFFVLGRGWRVQAATAVGLLVAYWAAFQFLRPAGVTGAWAKGDVNFGAWLDKAVIGRNWSGGYVTVNFVTSAANVIAGVMAGELVRAALPLRRKVITFAVGGVALIAAGYALSPWVPVVKRIWTPSFALVSTGWSLLVLLAFFAIHRAWRSVPWTLFIVVGANCIFLYLANIILGSKLRDAALTYTRWLIPDAPKPGQPALSSLQLRLAYPEQWRMFVTDWCVLGILVAVAWWMYRRKIFIKL